MYTANPLRLQPLRLVLFWRRRKVAKLREAEQEVKDLRHDLFGYDTEIRRRGIKVRTCDDCDNLNFQCPECGTISCQSHCRDCQIPTINVMHADAKEAARVLSL